MNTKIDSLEALDRVSRGFQHSRIIQTAAKLRLFDHTRIESPGTIEDIAKGASISLRGAEILLDGLASMGLVIKDNGKYKNSDLAEFHLVSSSKSLKLYAMDHGEQIYRKWSHLPEIVKTGLPVKGTLPSIMDDHDANRVFIMAMHAHGFSRGQVIAKTLDLEGITRVVDIGGGPGSYLLALAEQKPTIQGTLVDIALTLQTAKRVIEEVNPEANIRFVEKDIFSGTDPFASNQDLAILSNVMHIVGAETNIQLLKRTFESLKPGGRVIIQEFLLDETSINPQRAAIFAVNMLVSTESGRAWKERVVRTWMEMAGFVEIERLKVKTDSDLLIAQKPQ